ncbi:hypothetical protein Fmac_001782 [Flemingia macrophylla]|uniref:Reverse transcriptase n=1 Tax=Flemingia macrophylla TaxID=520843 RepID=A0ABD1NI24_9FABA
MGPHHKNEAHLPLLKQTCPKCRPTDLAKHTPLLTKLDFFLGSTDRSTLGYFMFVEGNLVT